MSAERSLPSLFRMLGHIDAVHGTYYLFLHFWIQLFGASELSTRLPSAIAIGIATAGTAVLARRLINTRVAVVAALVFAVLPRVTYMGAEARSTAMATAIAVWLTILLVHALDSRSARPGVRFGLWAGYGVLFSAGLYVFLDSVLLVPVYALAVLLLTDGHRRWTSLARWAVATAAGLALAAPVLYWGVGEHDQLSFIARRPQISVFDAAVDQWFGNVALAAVAWALVFVAIAAVFLGRRDRPTPAPATRGVLAVLLAWMVIPSAVLLIGTHLIAPMYALRYLSICAPAAAIVLAVGIVCFRARGPQAAALLVVVALAVPSYVSQVGPFAKNGGSDWRQAAAVLQADAKPGDGVVFDGSVLPSRKPRLAKHLYPNAFAGLNDITLARPYQSTSGLWDKTMPLASATDRLTHTNTVWLLQFKGSKESRDGTNISTLQQLGFAVTTNTTVNRTIIIEMTR